MSISKAVTWGSLAALVLLLGIFSGCGVTASAFNPGYADLNMPRQPGITRDMSISLGKLPLRLVASQSADDPETAALLDSLKGVRVSIYRVASDVDRVALARELGAEAGAGLSSRWDNIVRVDEGDKLVNIFLREDGDRIRGLALVVLDGSELVFLNVMGDVRAESLRSIGGAIPQGDLLASGLASATSWFSAD